MNARLSLATLAATALLGTTAVAQTAEPPPAQTMPRCDKPLASVMIGQIACKSANCGNPGTAGQRHPLMALLAASGQGNISAIGDGLKDMFVTVLRATNCVELQEREAMDEVAAELARVGKKVELQQADFLVLGSLTTVELSSTSASFGGGFIPIIGSIGSSTQNANVAMDVRLVDVNKARVVDTRRVEASSESTSWGVGGLGIGTAGGAGFGFGGGFSALKGTSLEAVSRDAVLSAAAFVIEALQRQKGVVAAGLPVSQPAQLVPQPAVVSPAVDNSTATLPTPQATTNPDAART